MRVISVRFFAVRAYDDRVDDGIDCFFSFHLNHYIMCVLWLGEIHESKDSCNTAVIIASESEVMFSH